MDKASFFSSSELIELQNRFNTDFPVVAHELYIRAVDCVKENNLIDGVDIDNVAADILNNREYYTKELFSEKPRVCSIVEVILSYHDWKHARRLNDISMVEQAAMTLIFKSIHACEYSQREKANFVTTRNKTPKELVKEAARLIKKERPNLSVASLAEILHKKMKLNPGEFDIDDPNRIPKPKTLQNSWLK